MPGKRWRSAGHLRLGLLHAVLAEQAMAGLQHGQDVSAPNVLVTATSGRRRVALGRVRRGGDALLDVGEAGGGLLEVRRWYVLPISQERG